MATVKSAKKVRCAEDVLDSSLGLAVLLEVRVREIREELERAIAAYERLKKVGGGRDDHAADFLKGTRRNLDNLRLFAERSLSIVDSVIANPFGRE